MPNGWSQLHAQVGVENFVLDGPPWPKVIYLVLCMHQFRVSVQGVKSLGGHFACLCRGFEFYEVKKKFVIIFQKENGNTFTLFIIFVVKSLQKEQNSTNLLLCPLICRNKSAITPKWFNSLDTNSKKNTSKFQFKFNLSPNLDPSSNPNLYPVTLYK